MSISEGRFLDILGENLIVIARLPFNTTRRVFSIEAFAAAITNLSPRPYENLLIAGADNPKDFTDTIASVPP